MLGYFIKRIALIIPTMLAVILIIFLLMSFLPGTNTRNMINYTDGTGGKTLLAQYLNYCKHVFFKLDFGMDRSTHVSISDSLLRRFKGTVKLTGLGFLITVAIGLPAGIYSALHAGKWQDSFIGALTTVFSAIPTFCIALGIVLLFVLRLRWFNVLIREPADYLMPLGTLSIMGIASVTRITRSAMLDVMSKEYMTALRSLGIGRTSLILKHGLKNALVQITSVLSSLIAQMMCGAIVIERFFTLPGLGFTLGSAISSRNTGAVMGIVVCISLSMCVINLVTDMIYIIVNPDIRSSVSWRSSVVRKGGVKK